MVAMEEELEANPADEETLKDNYNISMIFACGTSTEMKHVCHTHTDTEVGVNTLIKGVNQASNITTEVNLMESG